MGNHYKDTSAFTLIELLVVVSILGLLIAMLLPSLSGSREQAKSVACGTRLRELGMANQLYVGDYNTFPGHKWQMPDGQKVRWPTAISAYLGSDERQLCPSVPDWAIGRNNSYGYNYKYLGSLRLNEASPTRPYERFPVARVAVPADTIAYADSDGTGWTEPYTPDPTLKLPNALGHHGYTLDPTFIPLHSLQTINADGEDDSYAFRQHRTYISDRHRGGSNAVWTDGHVTPITPREVYQDNRFWNGLGREDPELDPHVDVRVSTGTFRYADQIGGER